MNLYIMSVVCPFLKHLEQTAVSIVFSWPIIKLHFQYIHVHYVALYVDGIQK